VVLLCLDVLEPEFDKLDDCLDFVPVPEGGIN